MHRRWGLLGPTQIAQNTLKTLTNSQRNIRSLFNSDRIEQRNIRNICITSHVDHGKSTLADRLLQMSGVIGKDAKPQFLDSLEVERQRGITVKAQTCSLIVTRNDENFLINLIDTPGHSCFSYETFRSMSACEGAVLLIDAVQGVQAQTVYYANLAKTAGLHVVGAANKIDVSHAEVPETKRALCSLIPDRDVSDFVGISGKTGLGVDSLIDKVLADVPAPAGDKTQPLKLYLFDLWFESGRGVVLLVKVLDGVLTTGENLVCLSNERKIDALEIGVMHPSYTPVDRLHPGSVGYVAGNVKTGNLRNWRIGDTLVRAKEHPKPTPVPGLKAAQCMVYAGVFPADPDDQEKLEAAMLKFSLVDASIEIAKQQSLSLGTGYRCGFLGLLHMEIFKQRMQQELDVEVLLTSPTVPYVIVDVKGKRTTIDDPADWPEKAPPTEIYEPVVDATIIGRTRYVNEIQKLCLDRRGEALDYTALDGDRVLLKYELPLSEIITDFYQNLQSLTHGYATFTYENEGKTREADVVKVTVKLNGKDVEPLSFLSSRARARDTGIKFATRLKTIIRPHAFDVPIQVCVGGKIVLRDNIKANKQSVVQNDHSLAGDPTRRMKLLKAHKDHQKKMREFGKVRIPPDAFLEILRL